MKIKRKDDATFFYEGERFLAEICKDLSDVEKGYTRLSYMKIKGNNSFIWGEKEDIWESPDEFILIEPVLPEPLNNRGHMGPKKKDYEKVLSLMVVVSLLKFLTLKGGAPFVVFTKIKEQ